MLFKTGDRVQHVEAKWTAKVKGYDGEYVLLYQEPRDVVMLSLDSETLDACCGPDHAHPYPEDKFDLVSSAEGDK